MAVSWMAASQKLILEQNFLRRNWMPEQISGLLIHVISTLLWLLSPVKVTTSSEFNGDYFRLTTFLIVQASRFFIHVPFPNIVI